MPLGRKSPLEALAMPGAIIAYKYSQYRQRRREAANRRVTERELTALHNKIEKLLSKLEESELEPPTSQEDECVICINARATMQTSPCGHKVVCRRCFVKTIQSAVAQRLLPLRCVICRARINRLTSGSTSWRLQGSASSYSMGSKSWSVPGSASSYSVDAARVTQSASLYSMSSGSSCMSGISNISSCSGTSGTSGMSSSSSNSGTTESGSSSQQQPPPHHHHHHHQPQQNGGHHHKHSNGTCSNGCLGAIPRNPAYQHHHKKGQYYSKNRIPEMPNRLPPIIEFKSPTRHRTPSPVNPGARFKYYTQPGKPANPMVESIPLISIETCSSKSGPSKLGLNGKIAPTASKSPINRTNMATGKPVTTSLITAVGTPPKARVVSAASSPAAAASSGHPSSSNSNKSINNNSSSNHTNKQDEKYDNKKNETIEKKKKEEKLKLKAEKEARKEEKRIAKEEEKLAKMLAKEEKKRGKKEAKESLLANEGGCRK
ncbi:ensconsin [Toxorhynchites rutilus septentrionalis]|uniref:ensconsin n=1 Tax=Toxorhynchites rutilus septentrionalis TaxID=329112 RepID=UPI00247AFA49|nr:ensconsin [Toxorhynchites rutilus septentrionalis]XP_055619707.1 ensconsin [Toxorhynchites rutilus septentrionalis]XP_055619708.1 ensconsin [Toxorhynchites rutilus septentrionalis]XP_055619709.1 ensconsin [Toxorhynchites rutilus septentrionalis]